MKKIPRYLAWTMTGFLLFSSLFGCAFTNQYSPRLESSRHTKVHDINFYSQLLKEHRKYATEINGSKVTAELHAGNCDIFDRCDTSMEYFIGEGNENELRVFVLGFHTGIYRKDVEDVTREQILNVKRITPILLDEILKGQFEELREKRPRVHKEIRIRDRGW